MGVALDAAEAKSRRRLMLIVVAEVIAIAAVATAMFVFEMGWTGAIALVVIVAGFTVLLLRAGEDRARVAGNFTPAMGRYNRRMLTAGAIYVVGLFGAIWAHDTLGVDGALAFLFAFAPSIGVLMMVWSMARLIAEEDDEYLRHRHIRAALFGLGSLLTLATVWGFFEQFDLVPHVPTWLAVPVFALGMGFANCARWGSK